MEFWEQIDWLSPSAQPMLVVGAVAGVLGVVLLMFTKPASAREALGVGLGSALLVGAILSALFGLLASAADDVRSEEERAVMQTLSDVEAELELSNELETREQLLVYTASGLPGVDLTDRDFTDAPLTNRNLAGAVLRGANFTRCSCTGTDFSRADLSEAIFADAVLADADLEGAVLSRAEWSSSTIWPEEFATEIASRSTELPGGSFEVDADVILESDVRFDLDVTGSADVANAFSSGRPIAVAVSAEHSALCVNPAGTSLEQSECSEVAGPSIVFQPDSGDFAGSWVIKNLEAQCLTLVSSDPLEGLPPNFTECQDSDSQKWLPTISDSSLEVRPILDPQLCLDVPYGSLDAGTTVATWWCGVSDNQRFEILGAWLPSAS